MLKWKIYPKYILFEASELKSLSCNERNFPDALLQFTVFLSQ